MRWFYVLFIGFQFFLFACLAQRTAAPTPERKKIDLSGLGLPRPEPKIDFRPDTLQVPFRPATVPELEEGVEVSDSGMATYYELQRIQDQEELLEAERNQAEALRDIARGLDEIRPTTGAMLRAGTVPSRPPAPLFAPSCPDPATGYQLDRLLRIEEERLELERRAERRERLEWMRTGRFPY